MNRRIFLASIPLATFSLAITEPAKTVDAIKIFNDGYWKFWREHGKFPRYAWASDWLVSKLEDDLWERERILRYHTTADKLGSDKQTLLHKTMRVMKIKTSEFYLEFV